MRQELDALGKGLSDIRDQASKLTARMERSMSEYESMKEKLEGDKKGLGEQNRQKEVIVRKLNAELAAADAEAKDAEREAKEYSDEVSSLLLCPRIQATFIAFV